MEMDDRNTTTITPQELAKLIETVLQNLSKLNQFDELPNVSYDSPNSREAYQNAANGIFVRNGATVLRTQACLIQPPLT